LAPWGIEGRPSQEERQCESQTIKIQERDDEFFCGFHEIELGKKRLKNFNMGKLGN